MISRQANVSLCNIASGLLQVWTILATLLVKQSCCFPLYKKSFRYKRYRYPTRILGLTEWRTADYISPLESNPGELPPLVLHFRSKYNKKREIKELILKFAEKSLQIHSLKKSSASLLSLLSLLFYLFYHLTPLLYIKYRTSDSKLKKRI